MQQNEEPIGFDRSYRVPYVQQAVVCALEYRRKALQGVFYVTKRLMFASGKTLTINMR